MQDLISEFLKKTNVYAVVGVSKDPSKYGHQVYKDLKAGGYRVYPVNPGLEEVLGDKCCPSLSELPEPADVVDIVTPPLITQKVVEECKDLGVTKVWLQPGAESEEVIRYCAANGLDCVHDLCVMIERARQKA